MNLLGPLANYDEWLLLQKWFSCDTHTYTKYYKRFQSHATVSVRTLWKCFRDTRTVNFQQIIYMKMAFDLRLYKTFVIFYITAVCAGIGINVILFYSGWDPNKQKSVDVSVKVIYSKLFVHKEFYVYWTTDDTVCWKYI